MGWAALGNVKAFSSDEEYAAGPANARVPTTTLNRSCSWRAVPSVW